MKTEDILKDFGYDTKRRRKERPDPNRPDLLRHVDDTWKEKVPAREAPWRTVVEDIRRRRGFPRRR